MCDRCKQAIAEAWAECTPTRKCTNCNGRGTYYGRGAIVNGKFEGFTGKCFQCNGTGQQTKSDAARTIVYWRHHARVEA